MPRMDIRRVLETAVGNILGGEVLCVTAVHTSNPSLPKRAWCLKENGSFLTYNGTKWTYSCTPEKTRNFCSLVLDDLERGYEVNEICTVVDGKTGYSFLSETHCLRQNLRAIC